MEQLDQIILSFERKKDDTEWILSIDKNLSEYQKGYAAGEMFTLNLILTNLYNLKAKENGTDKEN